MMILNVVDVSEVKMPDEKTRVYPVPSVSILISSKVATPLEAVCVVVPDKDPGPGFVPITTMTWVEESPLLTLLYWSLTWTVTAGEKTAFLQVLEISWLIFRLSAAAALTVRSRS